MKSYKEMADTVLKRRDEYLEKRTVRTQSIVVCVVSALFIGAMLFLGSALLKNGTGISVDIPSTTPHGSTSPLTPPVSQPSTGYSNDTPPASEPSTSSSGTNDKSAGKTSSTDSSGKSTLDTTVMTNTTVPKNIDNGVLEKATSEKMSVPENMKWLGTDDATEENNAATMNATVVLYQLDGAVINWTTEDDLIYVITAGNNRLVVIDSKTMVPLCNVPLAGKPAELNLIGNAVYISLPDLCRIDVFSKTTYAKTSSLYFEHEVSSFCIDGNYVYYSEHDQHCAVYRMNTATNELVTIHSDRGSLFYQPKLYLNKQDNLLYVGETGTTGSALYYYDATTLQLKSVFRKNDYGIMNHTRDIFHVGDEIFWGNYRLSDTNAKQIVGRYGVADYGSVNFASAELVSTFEGLFLTDTYECIVNYFDANFDFQYILVTRSYNVFFRERSFDNNIILGVNFSVQ